MADRVKLHGDICDSLKTLYAKKNADYGDSFSVLRKEYPNTILVYLTAKLNRLKQLSQKDYVQQVTDESIDDTLQDIANYAIMELTERSVDYVNSNPK